MKSTGVYSCFMWLTVIFHCVELTTVPQSLIDDVIVLIISIFLSSIGASLTTVRRIVDAGADGQTDTIGKSIGE